MTSAGRAVCCEFDKEGIPHIHYEHQKFRAAQWGRKATTVFSNLGGVAAREELASAPDGYYQHGPNALLYTESGLAGQYGKSQ